MQPHPLHKITMLQRNPEKMGRKLGKTTGWIHRTILKQNRVQQISGVKYLQISDRGILISYDKQDRMINSDTIIICAGQIPNDQLAGKIEKLGITVHKIGGAKDSNALDAVRAFKEGTYLAAKI